MFDVFITYQARLQPDRNAVVTPGGSLTFGELDVMINRFARALAEVGIPGNAIVAVRVGNAVTHWLVLLGLSRLGIASACAADAAASFRIDDQEPPEGGHVFYASDAWVSATWAGSGEAVSVGRLPVSGLGRVLLSSGTTGQPKRVGLDWAMIDANVRNAVLVYGGGAGSPWLVEMGIDTVFGFTVPLAAWAAGHAVHVRGGADLVDTLLRSPVGLLGMIPLQLADTLERLPKRFRPLPGCRLIMTGGRLSAALAQEARLRLTPDVRLVYGASECGIATMADAAWLGEHAGVAGYAVPGVTVEIVDDAGRPVGAGVQGLVRIRSNRVVGRYLDAGSGAFRDGGFYPGDLGKLFEDGLLVVDGRADDLMNLGGVKVLPGVVEAALLACPGVADVAAFAVPTAAGLHQCWVALVRGAGFDQDAVVGQVAASLPWLPPLRLVAVERLPRNAMGKVERAALVAAALDGGLLVG